MSEENARPYDIVVFGSTGYTGKFVAEETYRMQSQVHRSLRWTAAGRSEEKVHACLEGKTERESERGSERGKEEGAVGERMRSRLEHIMPQNLPIILFQHFHEFVHLICI